MNEEKFDFENLKVYQKALTMDSNLRIPVRNGFKPFPTELRTIFLRKDSFDEILSQLTRVGLPAQPLSPRKVLFWGEEAGAISSYVAGWIVSKGIDVIMLDGANRFDPYMVSSFARKALIPPERLLKRIRIARAFTCYQMATLMGEQLASLLRQEGATAQPQKPWVILLGPITTFLDKDVPEREVRPLFERSLRKVEEMAVGGIPCFLFQPNPPNPPLVEGGFMSSKKAYLMKRLFQFSNLVWRISLDDQGPRVVMEKSPSLPTKSNVFPSPLMWG
jgi:hypothetical protein